MIPFILKLKAIYYILFSSVGISIFKEEPTEGDTITVGNMTAIFKNKK